MGVDTITATSSVVGRIIKLINIKSLKHRLTLGEVPHKCEPPFVAPWYISGARKAKQFAQGHSASKQQSGGSNSPLPHSLFAVLNENGHYPKATFIITV